MTNLPDEHGRFGPFGGQFVPETLMAALRELVDEYTSDITFRLQRDFFYIDIGYESGHPPQPSMALPI